MFCYQCQETVKNQGCTKAGVCGKNDSVATLQDLINYLAKGIAYWAKNARKTEVLDNEVNKFIVQALFTTITNVNFDEQRMIGTIQLALKMRNQIKDKFLKAYQEKNGQKFKIADAPNAATWQPKEDSTETYLAKGHEVGILADKNEDIRSLKSLILFGLKGIAAYADHAFILKQENPEIFMFLQDALVATLDEQATSEKLLDYVLKTGQTAVDTMALLDKANTEAYGVPEITQVETSLKEAPGILVSGHDLLDLEELLKQTECTGINIYTHGEMLPANAYPGLKKYKHLAGNFGTSWYNQQKEFTEFAGPIVMTTNCIVHPKDEYKNRLYTTGLVGWPDVNHLANRKPGAEKDFSQIIKQAKELGNLQATECKKLTIGFNHRTLLGLTDKIIAAVKAGKIRRFFVMAGCDGRHKEREYFTQVAKELPKDTVILTAGCAKYRYNMLDLGDIDGIPRVVDAGQCNDSYSLAYVALKLQKAFGLDDINDLPISYDIAWYEQKAVAVLLALLSLGIKGIRLGPTLPAFVSENVLKVLVDKFDIKPTTNSEADIEMMLAGK